LKLTTEQARDYVITLFGFVKIQMPTKANNENRLMAEQFKNLFMKYTLDEMKIGFQDVLSDCVLPNENLSGRLPKIGKVRELLDARKIPEYSFAETGEINQGSCPPTVFKCLMEAMGRGDGKGNAGGGWARLAPADFNLKEYYIKLIKSHGEDQFKMCKELENIENQYIELGII